MGRLGSVLPYIPEAEQNGFHFQQLSGPRESDVVTNVMILRTRSP